MASFDSLFVYRCDDKKNVINKTLTDEKRMIEANVLSGDFKHLTVRVVTDDTGFMTSNYRNYAKLIWEGDLSGDFYYFITSKKSITNRAFEFELELDVLMTYANIILDETYIIERAENNYSLYLKDNAYAEYAFKKNEVITFPRGFSDDASTILLTTNCS